MSTYKPPYSEGQLERLITERFSVALMNDSKWDRLLGRLTAMFQGGVHIAYKLIHSDTIHQTALVSPDIKPFFMEPTLYREIEWIEFLNQYEDYAEQNNRKAGTRVFNQDITAIEAEIQRSGTFQLEHVPTGLRLHAYK